jgi:hypothetical protein
MMGLRQDGIGSGQWRIMAPTDPPADPAGDHRPADGGLDEATRERLLAVLYRELAASKKEALDRGVPQERLAANLAQRVAILRERIKRLSGEDVPNDFGNTP